MTQKMTYPDIRTTIRDAMQSAFPAVEARVAEFYAMQEYHLGWRDTNLQPILADPGKLLRPQLALLTCRAVGGEVEEALPLAAAIQLIHDFSLIHDDIEDNSDTRRGRPALWKRWGIAQGINAGDGMFVIAHLSLYRLSDVGVPADIVLRVMQRFDEINLQICEGQFLDMSFEGKLDIREDDYLAMISRKTAALLAGSASLGAIVGGGDEESVAALFNFGQSLGLAFQIQDDILGIWGDPATTGKPYAADIYQRKLSLPIIHVLGQAAPEAGHSDLDQSVLARVYAQDDVSEEDVAQVLAALDIASSRSYCEQVAIRYHEQALQALSRVQTGGNTDAEVALAQIHAIVQKLLGRKT